MEEDMTNFKCKGCGEEVKRRGSKPGVFCSMDCKAQWQRDQKPVDRDWLYQKYVVEGLGANAIAAIVHRDSKRVWQWLQDYGIETSPRGHGHGQHRFVNGDVSPFKGHTHTDEVKEVVRKKRLQDGHVPYLKNGVHHLKGKRGDETPNWKGGVTPQRQKVYESQEWKDAVKTVWQRDNAMCRRCGLDHRIINREEIRFAVHHIVSFAEKSLRCDPDNLVLLCRKCHLFVHSRENVNKEFLR
jgi:HNH endonuclease